MEKEYGTLGVKWGDVLRFRRGNGDLPGQRRAVVAGRDPHDQRRPVHQRQDRSRVGRHVLRRHRVLDAAARRGALSYGNWSKEGSKHIEDQLPLLSRKEMRPMWRDRKEIEANLEARKVF